VYIDPQNGLDRTSEANALVKRGLSIADTEVRQKYQHFVIVMDSMLMPDHLGLALETNLIRDAAGASMYEGVKKAVNETAAKLRAANTKAKLSISVQAEHAWAGLPVNHSKELKPISVIFHSLKNLEFHLILTWDLNHHH